MLSNKLVLALASARVAVAHFGLTYPLWRFDTLSEAGEAKYSQWTYPCAGVAYKTGNVTDWPIGGGSLRLDLHHAWTYVFNVSGKGTLCVDKLPVPIDVRDGALASLQVVTVGESGSALYNCADIRFRRDAKGPGDCASSKGLVYQKVKQQSGDGGAAGNSSTNGTAGNATKGSAGIAVGANMVALLTAAGLASGFALGL
ncbi:hypothetical protein C2857_007689 [Epichloe festucae Fl1]|uniref:Copper acquisition factor BIM1-like domain-containing protein n=1 Tax=Epichloe festucae (strain Fl1) TaxID=877507 RepID=A0A7S9KMR2_EPIFF|nr:hypothetical protein C2857_007689 [Epichloe festucae Fl1]